jgi:hypothetical protein
MKLNRKYIPSALCTYYDHCAKWEKIYCEKYAHNPDRYRDDYFFYRIERYAAHLKMNKLFWKNFGKI